MPAVGRPLTPAVLAELKALTGWPPPSDDFQRDGDWVHSYRIWTCHGYTDRSNQEQGFLRLQRTGQDPGKAFSLKIDQQVVHTAGIVHELEAHIICLHDQLASPQRWSLTSRFSGPDGSHQKDLSLRQEGRCRKGRESGDSHRSSPLPPQKRDRERKPVADRGVLPEQRIELGPQGNGRCGLIQGPVSGTLGEL